MENLPIKAPHTQIVYWKDTNAGMVALLVNGKFEELAKSVPNKIYELLECEPIQSLISHAGSDRVKAYLEAEIVKLALNFNGNPALNIKDYQVPAIAEQLIENYKWESIEDFTLCFRRASAGLYGEIYRIDGAVIGQWFSRYLDEKYDALEQKKAKEKHSDKGVDLAKIAKEQEEKYGKGSEYYKEAEKILEGLLPKKPVPTDNAKENEFQRQKLQNSYPVTPPEEVQKKVLHIQYLREMNATGLPREQWEKEELWLKGKK